MVKIASFGQIEGNLNDSGRDNGRRESASSALIEASRMKVKVQ